MGKYKEVMKQTQIDCGKRMVYLFDLVPDGVEQAVDDGVRFKVQTDLAFVTVHTLFGESWRKETNNG